MFFTPPPPPPQPIPITIWVHGTMPHALVTDADISAIIKPMTQTPVGLHPLSALDTSHYVSTSLHALSTSNAKQYPLHGIYVFGWSGALSPQERCHAGQQLFNAIHTLSEQYKSQYHHPPTIQIIAHSHGGNVAFLMATACHESEPPFYIEKLIVLGCPVQQEPSQYINHALFNNVYSLHSHDEWIQIADFTTHTSFEHILHRWRENHPTTLKQWFTILQTINLPKGPLDYHFEPHEKLVQAHIKWQDTPCHGQAIEPSFFIEYCTYALKNPFNNRKRGLFHTEFTTPLFLRSLSDIIIYLDTHKEEWNTTTQDLEYYVKGF